MTVRTRFAPSPTGFLHIGSVRTALYAWLYARHHRGQFVLRIEDTDRQRSTKAAVDAIIDGLAWVGLDADEGPIFQTTRFARYREVADRLLAEGKAYHCYCTRDELDAMRAAAQAEGRKPRYDGRCRDGRKVAGVTPAVRFKNPLSGQVVLDDLVKGQIVFDNAELDDLVIMRGDATPTYNFAVVVDDIDMAISHVIRGDDHVNNTPRQINLFRALGAKQPAFGHLSMIHGADGTKLSKRHGAVNILEYRDAGFLPEAMVNYLARLGWSHGNQEIFTRDELIEHFDTDHVNRAAATFDAAKLLWVNQQHLMSSPPARVAPLLGDFIARAGLDVAAGPPLEVAVAALRERAQTLAEMAAQAHPFYADFETFDAKAASAHLTPASRAGLVGLRAAFAALPSWSETTTQPAVEAVAGALGLKLGKVAQPLRVALTGTAASPGIGTTLVLVGRERALARIDRAVAYIDGHAGRGPATAS
jgi:glutamyl-tRNA synthetase